MNGLVIAIFLGTFVAVVGRQLTLRGPPVWAIFGLGAMAMVAAGTLSPAAASLTLSQNLPVFLFLLALFLFATALEQAGALDHLARWILSRTRRPRDVPFVLFVGLGSVSALLLNDGLVLVGVPLVLALARRLRAPPVPLLLTLGYAVTVGSVPTPFGNPQNLLVSLQSGLPDPIAEFLRYLLLPTAINLLVGGWYLRRRFGKLFEPAAPTRQGELTPVPPPVPLFPPLPYRSLIRRSPVVAVFPATIGAMVSADLSAAAIHGPSVPLFAVAFVGAMALLLVSPGRNRILRRVDWGILLLFAALFLVVAGAASGGVLAVPAGAIGVPSPGNPPLALATVLLGGVLGSQVVSNVPWVALQVPLLKAAGYGGGTPLIWMALAGGSTLAGNLTLLGAASNLILVAGAEKAGLRIGLREFVRDGAPLCALTVGVLFACLAIGL